MKYCLILIVVICSASLPGYAQDLAAGQVWAYDTREGEEQSRLLILKVEDLDGHQIVHVAVSGLMITRGNPPEAVIQMIQHMPFDGAAVKASLVRQEGFLEVPSGLLEGYSMWRTAYEKGEAGVYTISIADAVNSMEIVLNQ